MYSCSYMNKWHACPGSYTHGVGCVVGAAQSWTVFCWGLDVLSKPAAWGRQQQKSPWKKTGIGSPGVPGVCNVE